MTQKKARQALDRSRKVVDTKIYIYNKLFTWDRKVLDKSDKHSTDQERLSTQYITSCSHGTENYSTNQESLSR